MVMACAVLSAGAASAQNHNSWQGFYVGGHGAYLSSDTSYTPGTAPGQSLDGALLGLQAGYNWQVGNVVVGAEADISWGNIKDHQPDGNFLSYDGKLSTVGTVRGRVGYSFGSFMPFLTAGYVWASLDQGSTCVDGATAGRCTITGPFKFNSKETLEGWVYGGGFEYALAQHWSLKAEVLFGEFDTKNFTATVPVVGKVTAPADLNLDYMAKVGVNYRF